VIDQSWSPFCRSYLSRQSAKTTRLRVSLRLNLSIYTSHRPFVVRCSRSPHARLRGGISFWNPIRAHVTARVRACLESQKLGLGAANQPLRLHWLQDHERLQEAVHRLQKTRDSSCNAVTTTLILPIHHTLDLHTTMPSANCKCSIATRIIAFN